MDYKNLKKLVARNSFEEVFENLSTGIPEEKQELHNELNSIEGSYDAYKRKERIGVLSNTEAIAERNKVSFAVIEFIDLVKKKLA